MKTEEGKAETNKISVTIECGKQVAAKTAEVKRQFTYKEKREFEQLEKEIPALTKEKEEITYKLNSGAVPFDELQALANRIAVLTTMLDAKELRWLELSELQ
jgi:ATP-binding cassette subfamily F protein uup